VRQSTPSATTRHGQIGIYLFGKPSFPFKGIIMCSNT
jgi:hypothetical protein